MMISFLLGMLCGGVLTLVLLALCLYIYIRRSFSSGGLPRGWGL